MRQSAPKCGLCAKARHCILPIVAHKPKKDARLTLRVTSDCKRGLRDAVDKLDDRTVNWLAQDILEKWVARQRKRRRR